MRDFEITCKGPTGPPKRNPLDYPGREPPNLSHPRCGFHMNPKVLYVMGLSSDQPGVGVS